MCASSCSLPVGMAIPRRHLLQVPLTTLLRSQLFALLHLQLRRGWHDLRMSDQEWQSQLQQSICRYKQVETGEGSWTPFGAEGNLHASKLADPRSQIPDPPTGKT